MDEPVASGCKHFRFTSIFWISIRTFYYHYGVISDKYLYDILINEFQEIKLSKAICRHQHIHFAHVKQKSIFYLWFLNSLQPFIFTSLSQLLDARFYSRMGQIHLAISSETNLKIYQHWIRQQNRIRTDRKTQLSTYQAVLFYNH